MTAKQVTAALERAGFQVTTVRGSDRNVDEHGMADVAGRRFGGIPDLQADAAPLVTIPSRAAGGQRDRLEQSKAYRDVYLPLGVIRDDGFGDGPAAGELQHGWAA